MGLEPHKRVHTNMQTHCVTRICSAFKSAHLLWAIHCHWMDRPRRSFMCAHARPTSNQDVTTKSRMPAEPQIQFLTNLRTFVNKIQSVMNSSAQASRWYPATSASDLIFVSTHSVTSLRAYIKVITGDVQAMATTSNQQQRRGKPLPVAFQAMRPHRKAAHHRKYAKHSASVP